MSGTGCPALTQEPAAMNRNEIIESTDLFEMQTRPNAVPGGHSVECSFVFGFSPKRRKPGKHTCQVRPGHTSFDSWGGSTDKVNLVQTERYLPELGSRLDVPVIGLLEVIELPSEGSPWLRLRRV